MSRGRKGSPELFPENFPTHFRINCPREVCNNPVPDQYHSLPLPSPYHIEVRTYIVPVPSRLGINFTLSSRPVPVPRNINENNPDNHPDLGKAQQTSSCGGLLVPIPTRSSPRGPLKNTLSIYRPTADVTCQAKTYLHRACYMVFGQTEPCRGEFLFCKIGTPARRHPLGDFVAARASEKYTFNISADCRRHVSSQDLSTSGLPMIFGQTPAKRDFLLLS